jgi:FtsZ-binding cell division protein ZapB
MVKKKTEAGQLPLSGTEEGEILAKLSERVERAVTTIQELRRDRDALRKKLDEAESKLREVGDSGERLSHLEEEHDRFQRERSEIRDRIESILGSLEALETAEEP